MEGGGVRWLRLRGTWQPGHKGPEKGFEAPEAARGSQPWRDWGGGLVHSPRVRGAELPAGLGLWLCMAEGRGVCAVS